ncbi:hypothetical protein EGI22_12080 [Lacihabitans sp. LS3-19]|uniref:hypothetical protein n=1 Tax=Lacihabitans sp. LS3-19 TaxID=2487335 RepID=UPI0020CDD8A3|nr:hypothetical protein [Lacihabitans sp. LS3-19]MCP9768655.1 hypothetical protein [Lacihabitans sp. LS3-19]
MERYVEQLIEEIISKAKPEKEPETWEDVDIEDALDEFIEYSDEELQRQEDKADEDLETHFQEIEKYLSGEAHKPLHEFLGIFPNQFPPGRRLNKKQKEGIIEAFVETLGSFHIRLDFPDGISVSKQYELVEESLLEDVFECTIGYTTIDFCSGDAYDCRFGKKCPCLKELLNPRKPGILDDVIDRLKNNRPDFLDEVDDSELPF